MSNPKSEAASRSYRDKVLAIVKKIPRGKVLSYGQVAAIAGSPRAARQVGQILHYSGEDERLPWQRVVNGQGKISTHRIGLGNLQKRLLVQEGVVFDRQEALDFDKFGWDVPERFLERFHFESSD